MNAIRTQDKTNSFVWLVGWTLASAAGLVVGFFVTLPLLWSVSEPYLSVLPEAVWQGLGGAFFGLGVGLAIGLGQWIVLRQHGETTRRWLGATVLGALAGGIATIFLSTALNDDGENLLGLAVSFGVFGTLIGAVQYALARSVARSALWIAASALGLGLGTLFPLGPLGTEILQVVMAGLVYGAITAAALWWMGKN
jgi:hypothetical protein